MKKLKVFGLSLLFVLVLFVSPVSAVRINEVELNPEGNDSGYEWIELYSENEINLTDWIIRSNNGRAIIFNASFSGYYILNTPYLLLTNKNQSLSLLNSSNNIIDKTVFIDDEKDDDRTWQYCDGNWIFENSTKNSANLCGEGDDEDNGNDDGEAEIFLELEWDEDDIINGEEFKIEVRAYNLKDEEYDIKIYIEDDDKVISDRYDKKEDEWKSGTYYINEILEGSGDETEDFRLRIKDKYRDFAGDAKIVVKIRDVEGSVDEVREDIEVLEKEEEEVVEEEEIKGEVEKEEENKEVVITNSVIRLGNRSKLRGNEKRSRKILYESGSEKVKKYAVYALNLVLIAIIIFLLIRFKKEKS